jgi:hypothetical protein
MAAVLCCFLWTQTTWQAQSAALLPDQPGKSPATFVVDDSQLGSQLKVIAYGDIRFTDPANTSATNPKVRRWLVQQIAREAPDALLINGDIPLSGDVKNDYTVFKTETAIWRNLHLRIYPALGNHEVHGNLKECLQNWWDTFPELRNRRWYSIQLGSRVYIVVLDSNESLLPGSEQAHWLSQQLETLPRSIDFVFIGLHHPPVSDAQGLMNASHNARPNEIAAQELVSKLARRSHARIIVAAGHVHNYERRIQDDVMYLVSGGGGAKPLPVRRTPGDLFTRDEFPNYNYVRFTLDQNKMHGTMFRISDPTGNTPRFTAEDGFEVIAKPVSLPH